MTAPARGGLAAAAVLLGLLLSACQTLPPPRQAAIEPATEIQVPFVPQEAYQCGPAALAMLLQWNHLPGDRDELVKEVWLPKRQGSLGIELMAAGRARGLLAYPVETPQALFAELQAGHPVLILQNLFLPQWPVWHYAVVIGYREDGDELILHSGTDRATTSHWNRFIRTWARAHYWGFVLLPAGQLPASVEPEPLLRALAPMKKNALPHWRDAVKRFPDNGRLRFGYANALWHAGDKQAALRNYESAARLTPGLADVWNNLAYARRDQGDQHGAVSAVCRARTLAPRDANIADSVSQITGGAGCPTSP